MTHLTVVTAHPDPQAFSRALAAAYVRGATAAGATVDHHDATQMRFDPILRGAHTSPMQDEPDLAALRASVDASDHVAFLFPTWWAGLPAALKGLVDRLFLPGTSFVYQGNALPRGLLAGRSARYVATMDSPAAWYWLAYRDALGGSFGQGTLKFVGFGPVDRTMVYRVRKLGDAGRAAWLPRMEALGRQDAVRAQSRRALQGGTPRAGKGAVAQVV